MESFFSRLGKIFKRASLKRDIGRLEQERAKEKTAMLRQRRFYEKLLRRKNAPLEPSSAPLEVKAEIKPEIKPEAKPEIKPEIKTEEVPETKVATPTQTETETKVEPKKRHASLWRRLQLSFRSSLSKSSLAAKLAEERKQEEAAQTKNEVEGRAWQAYNSVKANLVKDQGVLFFNWRQRSLTLALALVLCSLALGLVYVGLLIWQKERLSDNEATLANFEAINAEVAKNEKEIEEIIAFNRKLDVVSFILANHVHWTNYFDFLEANTLKSVYYQSFSGDISGNYSIPALAKDLDAISLQLEVMKAYNLMRSVQYSSASASAGGPNEPSTVNFNLEMSLDPKIFLK
jgi:hypothetical protein